MSENPPIGVIGVGWVGLVTAGCFADLGHDVWCRDIDTAKLAALREGKVPFYEPGLQELVERNVERLHFQDELPPVLEHARLLFVCVDTPPTYSGDADLSRVEAVVEELPDSAEHTMVMKSTVPCGTGANIRRRLGELGKGSLGYAANPEFRQEGSAVADFMQPDRVVIGSESPSDRIGDALQRLYEPLGCPIVRTDVASAEMIKLASNAFLATKISFINEIANVCEELGADVSEVASGMGLDPRIGGTFLQAGIGYGGSCLVGDELLLVRVDGQEETRRTFRQLFDSHDENAIVGPERAALVIPHDVEVLAWREGSPGAEFRQVSTITRRHFSGKGVEVVAQGGRRVRCTPDHPFVVRREGVTALVQAQELRIGDQLPAVFLEQSQPGGINTDEQLLFAKAAAEAVIAPMVSLSLPVDWCPIGGLHRFHLDDDVYSLEVPSAHTFVANGPGGLVVHNCFPKDVSALKQLAGNSGYHFQLLTAVIEVNELQKRRVVNKLKRHLGSLIGKRIALLGLAFKPNTDDMREASSVVLAARLEAEGAIVGAYDPVAEDRAREMLPGVQMFDTAMDAIEGANAVVIVTEWPEFADLDLAEVRRRMADPVIVDGRNMLSAEAAHSAGLVYEGIGRT
jgi:UDP-glucose 6-dehydrogenase